MRDLFRRYLEICGVVRLKAVLDRENVRLPLRTDGNGKTIGGGLISRGHLYKILSNPVYFGRGSGRLMELPVIWADQWTALGLKAPANG